MPVRSTGQGRDKTPLLSSADSNAYSDGRNPSSAAADPPARIRQTGIRRLFTRNDPPGEKGKKAITGSRTTVDTRTIAKKQDPVEGPPAIQIRLNEENKRNSSYNRSPPRPLQENSRDSLKKKRLLPAPPIRKVPSNPNAKDPPAHNAAPSVVSMPTSTKSKNSVVVAAGTPSSIHSNNKNVFDRYAYIQDSELEPPGGGNSHTSMTAYEIASFATFPENGSSLYPVGNKKMNGDLDVGQLMGQQQQEQQQQQYQMNGVSPSRRHHHQQQQKHQAVRSSQSTGEHSTSTGGEDSIGTSTYQVLYARHEESLAPDLHPATTTANAAAASASASATPNRQHQHQHQHHRSSRGLLARPFGRTSLPPEIARKWVVEVSSAEWDADEKRWKYRILIQRRMGLTNKRIPKKDQDFAGDHQKSSNTSGSSTSRPQQSFTNAFTWRSLADFCWLEKALRREYHGGLLLPDLSIALGRPLNDPNLEETPCEAERLRNWLSDVLNGVRGQGELIFDHSDEVVNLLRSESMEAFLYRNAGAALQGEETLWTTHQTASAPVTPLRTGRKRESSSFNADTPSFLNSLNALLLSPLDLCVGPQPCAPMEPSRIKFDMANRGLPIIACQSRALSSVPSLDGQDSTAETADISTPRVSVGIALHSELLEAEKELVLHYRRSSLLAMEKLQHLQREEEKLGASWQRFAISLSNLFAFEKDVETIRLGESKARRENMPYRKVSKVAVDDCLRILSRQKVDRSLPALNSLCDMLAAYVADLSSVEPSVAVYLEGVKTLAVVVPKPSESASEHDESSSSRSSWEEKLRAVASATKSRALRSFGSNSTEPSNGEGAIEETNPLESEDRIRLLANEKLLRQSLTTMCRATPVRVSRMAWRYLNTEASQCALLHSAAVSLRKKIDVTNRSSVAKMLNRHHQEEKEDDSTELALIDRLIQLGLSTGKSEANAVDDHTRALPKEKALQIFRTRRGRWDASLAIAILEAVGVDDTNVKVDETSRELRMVRKYAVGLRENLSRCEEALRVLQESTIGEKGGAYGQNHIASLRNTFFVELSRVFNGTIATKQSIDQSKSSTLATSILSKAGIDTTDPFGWTPSTNAPRTTFTQGRLGDLAHAYFLARDERIEWLLRTIADLLKDYKEKVEIVEGFVYMECVGIQLEKFFSRKRSTALSAFEKKADLTAAINVATKKRIKKLVKELQVKLDELGPGVSQTQVKEAKDAHLESKEIKGHLHELAMRRLQRTRETSTERIIAIIDLWAKEEELSSARELKALGETMNALERSIAKEDFDSLVYRYSKRITAVEE